MDDTPPKPENPVPEEGILDQAFFEIPGTLAKIGDYIDIREKARQMRDVGIGVGWDQKMFEEDTLDVDLSCFLLNRNNQTRDDEDFVFYNNQSACEGGVRHMGDSRTGAGDGDDEGLHIDLNALPFDVFKVVFTISIYNAAEREQDFSQVKNLYFRVTDLEGDNEIFRFMLPSETYTGKIGIKVGELIREGPKWFFNVLGEPIEGGLAKIATEYGIMIANQ